MKLLLVGKYPPIQGGVSASTYWTAHALAKRGHEVHVLTNSASVEPTYKLHLFDDDSSRLEYRSGLGSVTLHQIEPLRPYSYIPWTQPYLTLLAGAAIDLAHQISPDLILGWYLEPYGVAAAIAAKAARLPLALRHAGSDISRLAMSPHLRRCYQWAIQDAAVVLTTPGSRDALKSLHPNDGNTSLLTGARLPEAFREGVMPADLALYASKFPDWLSQLSISDETKCALARMNQKTEDRDAITVGIYGKVGRFKGSFELIAALSALSAGRRINLFIIPTGNLPMLQQFFDQLLRYEGTFHSVHLLPPLAPWRIPGFIRACDAVFFLENNFPVPIHRPVVPREILSIGAALICSSEIVDSSGLDERLAPFKNYIPVANVTVDGLTSVLKLISDEAVPLGEIAARGRVLSQILESELEGSPIADVLENFVRLRSTSDAGIPR